MLIIYAHRHNEQRTNTFKCGVRLLCLRVKYKLFEQAPKISENNEKSPPSACAPCSTSPVPAISSAVGFTRYISTTNGMDGQRSIAIKTSIIDSSTVQSTASQGYYDVMMQHLVVHLSVVYLIIR